MVLLSVCSYELAWDVYIGSFEDGDKHKITRSVYVVSNLGVAPLLSTNQELSTKRVCK